MGYKVILSDRAIGDLREICKFIAKENPQAALNVGNRLIKGTSELADFPQTGKLYCIHQAGRIYHKVISNYRIFYRVDTEARTVDILHYRHGAQSEPTF